MAALADTAFSAQSPPGPGGGKALRRSILYSSCTQHNLHRGLACARRTILSGCHIILCSQYTHAFRGRQRRQRRRAPAMEAGGGQSRKERPSSSSSSRRRSRVQQHSTTAQCDQSIGCCSDNKNTASAAVISIVYSITASTKDLWPQS